MNELSLPTAQPSAVAPALVAARANVPSTTTGLPTVPSAADHLWGGVGGILTTLASRLSNLIAQGIKPSARSDSPDADALWVCKRLLAGQRNFATAAQLLRLLPTAKDTEMSKLARSIVDVLRRPEVPALLPAFTVELLARLSGSTICGLARNGLLHPRRESGRLYYDAAELEGLFRRHYNGSPTMSSRARVLLLERKCALDGHAAELLGLSTDQLRQRVQDGLVPSIRVGTATVLLRTDVLSAAALSVKDHPHLTRRPVREANRAA